jgi:hypothetical protein
MPCTRMAQPIVLWPCMHAFTISWVYDHPHGMVITWACCHCAIHPIVLDHKLTLELIQISPLHCYLCIIQKTSNNILGVDTHGAHVGNCAEGYAMTWTSQKDELASTLEYCTSVFQSGMWHLQDSSIKNLVFCEPLKDANLLIPPLLQILASKNLPFLQYQD